MSDSSPIASAPDAVDAIAGGLPVIHFAGFRRWERDRFVPSHIHDNLHQFDYFSGGEGAYTINGTEYPVTPTTMFFVAAGHEHTMLGSEERPLVNLTVKFRHPGLEAGFLPPAMQVSEDLARDVAALMRSVISESVVESFERRLLSALRLAEVLIRLRCAWSETSARALNSPHVAAAKRFMHERYGENLTLDDVARAAGIAPAHLCRVFRKEMGLTPFDFLRRVRVERAKDWLARTPDRLGEVAAAAGFNSARDMTRAFQRIEGLSPREYRRRTVGAR